MPWVGAAGNKVDKKLRDNYPVVPYWLFQTDQQKQTTNQVFNFCMVFSVGLEKKGDAF